MISRNSPGNIDKASKPVPFRLKPSGKDYLWGGHRLNDELMKGIDMDPMAEIWECSTHLDGPSYVDSGAYSGMTLAKVLKEHPWFLGAHPKDNGELPILIKFIDANKDLSVQVHPDDDYAREHEHGQMGKSELWYVLDAGRDAHLVYGLNRDADEKTLRDAIAGGTLERYLQKVRINKGDLFFVRAGTIHALGAGALVAEIQENSNLTYRLYDYGRTDRQGKRRSLHVDQAMAVADRKASREPAQPMRVLRYRRGCARELLCRCQWFEVYRMLVNTERCRELVEYRADADSFRVLLCINGCGMLAVETGETLLFFKGDCIFFPADSAAVKIHGTAQFLDVRG